MGVTKRQYKYKKRHFTMDVYHDNKIQEYIQDNKNINTLYSNLEKLKSLNSSDNDIIYSIKELEKTILKTEKEQLQYLNNTSELLFDYYNTIENNNATPELQQDIQYFFNAYNTHAQETPQKSVFDNYLSFTDPNYISDVKVHNQNMCKYCNTSEMNELTNDYLLCCPNCNAIDYLMLDTDKPTYKEHHKEITYFSYNRMNHFSEWINQIQGKETTDIPQEVFDKILMDTKRYRIDNLATLTYDKIKEILKKNKLNKYYEHIPYIYNRITGKNNPFLTIQLEEKLKNMFMEIQTPFLKYAPKNRKNFLSYSYVLHKFLEILGEREYLSFFPLLKSREKLYQQEVIWKKICQDLNWQYIPSI